MDEQKQEVEKIISDLKKKNGKFILLGVLICIAMLTITSGFLDIFGYPLRSKFRFLNASNKDVCEGAIFKDSKGILGYSWSPEGWSETEAQRRGLGISECLDLLDISNTLKK
ncbi:MAG: hypothetical protein ACK481_04915 [Candidatus Melainabacteria bacterium]|jgi:hypothetical protein